MGSLIQQHRHEYMIIRKNSLPLKDQFSKLLRTENGIITPDILPIYNDLQDQLQFVIQTTESCREITSSLVDLYISNNDLRMNAIMKRLTIVSTLFIPLTFLVGVWGMNFKIMPELDWRYGYFIAWAVMIATGVLTWLYMRNERIGIKTNPYDLKNFFPILIKVFLETLKCSQIDPTDSPRSNMFMISPLWASKKNNLDSEPLGRPNRFPVLFTCSKASFLYVWKPDCDQSRPTCLKTLIINWRSIRSSRYITVVYTMNRRPSPCKR